MESSCLGVHVAQLCIFYFVIYWMYTCKEIAALFKLLRICWWEKWRVHNGVRWMHRSQMRFKFVPAPIWEQKCLVLVSYMGGLRWAKSHSPTHCGSIHKCDLLMTFLFLLPNLNPVSSIPPLTLWKKVVVEEWEIGEGPLYCIILHLSQNHFPNILTIDIAEHELPNILARYSVAQYENYGI